MPTALIAEDEPLLLLELRDLLHEAWPELEIVAEATSGPEALRLIGASKPDVAFLDIEMPRMGGLEIAAATPDTRVVFVTAHERYAVDAFAKGAADYLLKPVTPARIGLTVQRLQSLLEAEETGAQLRFVQAWQGNSMRVVPVEDVVALVSSDKYTRVITTRGDLLLRRSLIELMKELDPTMFWPISRGTVIHAKFIDHIERGEGRDLNVQMVSLAQPISVRGAYRDRFRGM